MKKSYNLLLLLLSFTFYGQIVSIPDANFKNTLVNTNCAIITTPGSRVDVDSNNDGEIQVSEAMVIRSLFLENRNIASLEGILSFPNLEILKCDNNTISQLVLNNLPNLTYLSCVENNLTNLDLIGISSLYTLYCSGNQLVSLDLSTNPELQFVQCYENALTTLNVSGLANLSYLECYQNQLQSLDLHSVTHMNMLNCYMNALTNLILPQSLFTLLCFSNNLTSLSLPSSLIDLRCANNQLTQLDLTGLDLYSLSVANNQLTSLEIPMPSHGIDLLDISGNLYTAIALPVVPIRVLTCEDTQLTSLQFTYPPYNANNGLAIWIRNNQNLQAIFMKNGDSFICYDPESCGSLIENNPSLEFICLDEGKITNYPEVLQAITNANNPNLHFSSYCTFTPGGSYNTITGNIKYDGDGNGCNSNEASVPSVGIKISQNNIVLGNTYSNSNGNYVSYTSSGNITLTPELETAYYNITPASYTSNFLGTTDTESANFCISPNGIHPDLEVGLIPITPARPGFDAKYKIIYKNKGTTTQSGNVTLAFQDDVTDYVSASTTPNDTATGLITWDFSNLAPFESREITVSMNVNSPIETPPVNVGSILIFHANITSIATDENPTDNDNNLEQIVVGSWDPNDKQASVLSYAYDAPDKSYLYYTIRFQNMGTYAAENVVVADILSDKLDDNTLQMVSASHPYQSRYNKLTKKLELIFEDINLPASINDEEASHGYVTFKIKPVSTVQQAQTVENKADIYFDFNAPVATNTTSTSFYSLLKTYGFGQDAFFTLHPNPAKNTINVNVAKAIKILSIRIYNPLGQMVNSISSNELSASTAIDVSSLNAGTYFMEITSSQGKTTKKFIKL